LPAVGATLVVARLRTAVANGGDHRGHPYITMAPTPLILAEATDYITPSFFCRLVDDVVYWNTSRLSGKT
jgi:hypothetical protein